MLKDVKFDVFCAKRNADDMVFIQTPPTGYSAVSIKTIINQRKLDVRPQMDLMKEDVVYLENDEFEKVKEAFGIFQYFFTYLKHRICCAKKMSCKAPKIKVA